MGQKLVIAFKEAVGDVPALLGLFHELCENVCEGFGPLSGEVSPVPEGIPVREELAAVTQEVEVVDGTALFPAKRFQPETKILLSRSLPQMCVRHGQHHDHRLHLRR